MPNFPDEPLSAVRARLLDGMVGFMEDDEDDRHVSFNLVGHVQIDERETIEVSR